MVVSPTIHNLNVTKTLIDGRAGLNVLSVEVFEKMQVPYKCLVLTRLFTGMTSGSTMPIRQVSLPVTFGTCKNYCTKNIVFDVAHISLDYNAILWYPALAKFMAITHHAYNTAKMPGPKGAITI